MDGRTSKEKYRAAKRKSVAQELLPDIMKIEELSKRGELNSRDIVRAVNLGIITRDEASLVSPSGEDPTDHSLSELRNDFEVKSKAESSGAHSHVANLSKADILERYFENVTVRDITPETIETFRAERRKTVSPTTVNHDLKILRKYLDIAVHKKWVIENQARKVKLLAEPKDRIPRCLYPDELRKFFSALEKHKNLLHGEIGFIVRFLIYTGLRRSELCSLKPGNVKLHLRQIHLIGKGKKARVVGIHHSLVKELEQRVNGGNVLNHTIDPSSISHAFKKLCREEGLSDDITLHSLRHTYISYMLESGVPSKKVRDRAGHFNLTVTDRYAHGLPSESVDEDVLDFGIYEQKKGEET